MVKLLDLIGDDKNSIFCSCSNLCFCCLALLIFFSNPFFVGLFEFAPWDFDDKKRYKPWSSQTVAVAVAVFTPWQWLAFSVAECLDWIREVAADVFFLPMDFLFFFEDFVGQKGQILPKARPANKVIKASKNLEMVGQCVLRLFVSSGAKCMHQNFPKL